MKKHKKYKEVKKNICIKISISIDDIMSKFILDNSFKRNKIRNDFREEANKYKGNDNMYWNFDPWKFHKEYYHSVEDITDSNGDVHDVYEYYCVGLSEQVADDFRSSLETIRTKNKKVLDGWHDNPPIDGKYTGTLGEYHFKKFDYNKYGFRVKLKPGYVDGKFYSRLCVLDKNTLKFRIRGNYHKDNHNRNEEYLTINLNENLYDDVIESKINDRNSMFIRYYKSRDEINGYSFLLSDIKDISFMHECGNYYILLFINNTYEINKSSRKYSKDRVCGIDTGIRHPVTLHDGNGTMYLSMDDKTTRKIHYLERRARRLEHYRSLKYNANIERTGYKYSNNTIKLTKKIRKLYRKITNIKNFWIQNRCKEIATTYSKICVDRFEQPEHSDEEKKKISKKALRKINYANRFHKMYYFNEFLKHDCIKYGCEYIESPEDTTRTCSICGYVNDHLPLNKTHLICAKCNNVIERDMNAARNCYDYLIDNV